MKKKPRPKNGPNRDCPCGSGRKYKRCHQRRDAVDDHTKETTQVETQAIMTEAKMKMDALRRFWNPPGGGG